MTLLGRGDQKMDRVGKQTRTEEMTYTIDDRQLLELWTVVSCLGHVREIPDPLVRSEILTRAQIRLTAFVLDLQPLPRDQVGAAAPRTFDA